MQQNITTLLLATLVGLVLSGYWMFHEIRFVSVMSEFDQEISWILQVPLMLFIAVLVVISFLLFIGTLSDFSFRELKAEVPWKKLLGSIIFFDSFILLFMFIAETFDIQKEWIGQSLVLVLLVATYIYAAVKQKINPIFFLLSLATVSGLLLYIVFEIIL